MTTTAIYPAYSSSSDWYIGAHATNLVSGVADGASGTTAGWFVRSMRLRLNPGTYTLQAIRAIVKYASTSKCDAVRFGIFGGNATAASLVSLSNGLTYVDVTTDKENTLARVQFVGDLGSVTVTLEADTTYWFALMLHKTAGSENTYPQLFQVNDGQWVLGDVWKGQVNGALAEMPTDTTGLAYTAAGDAAGEQSRMCLEFTATSRILYSIDSAAYAGDAVEMIIPRPKSTTPDYWIMLKDCVVEDGQALTVVLESEYQADEVTRTTLVLDMGETDQVTFGSSNVALNAETSEAGDAFDLGINVRGDNKMDLFFKNKDVGQGALGGDDLVTISHACKNGSARSEEYSIQSPFSLKWSGTATVASLQVGWEPLLILGDSNGIDNEARLGAYLPTAFTHARMYWNECLSGGKANGDTDTITSMQARYINDTPGLGDLCEMQGVLVTWAGMGVNDISAGIGTTEGNRNFTVASVLQVVATVAWKACARGNSILIIGAPPYSDENASTQEAKAIQHQLNIGLEGIACAVRGAYINPWYALVTGSQDADVPTANATYHDGLHYIAAGATLVASKLAAAYETGIVGGWWMSPNRREARSRGMLWPR